MGKMKTKKALIKRIKVTKKGKIKHLQASRSHLQRHKRERSKTALDLDKSNKDLVKLIAR